MRFILSPCGVICATPTQVKGQIARLGPPGRPNYAFGSGRRQCPGGHFASTEILLAAAKLLWACDVLPPPGGIDVSLETAFVGGMIMQPRAQPIVFRRRDPDRESGLLDDRRRTDAIAQELLA